MDSKFSSADLFLNKRVTFPMVMLKQKKNI